MAVLTSTLVFSLWIVCSASSEISTIEVDLGKDVVLDCTGSSNIINLVAWNRADLGPEEFIFFFSERRGQLQSMQLPSYQDRVFLQDPQMKNGNVAVFLKNVTKSDTGMYECLIRETKTGRRKRSAEPDEPQSRNKIQLAVKKSGSESLTDGGSLMAGGPHGRSGLLVAAVMLIGWI